MQSFWRETQQSWARDTAPLTHCAVLLHKHKKMQSLICVLFASVTFVDQKEEKKKKQLECTNVPFTEVFSAFEPCGWGWLQRFEVGMLPLRYDCAKKNPVALPAALVFGKHEHGEISTVLKPEAMAWLRLDTQGQFKGFWLLTFYSDCIVVAQYFRLKRSEVSRIRWKWSKNAQIQ